MPNTLKIKRGTAATIPQGQLAEPLFTTDTYDLYIGKGSGGNQRIQNYIASGTSSQFLKGDGSLDSTTYQATSEKGQNNGYASLDAGGKIPVSQLPSSVIEYKGTWNASTNTPTLADGTGDAGDVYIVSVGGTQNLGSGSITFDAGDWVMYNGSVWQKSTGSNAVASVNGQTGIVSIGVNDLDDATITSPSNGQLLQYSTGTNKWINWTPTYISAAITSLNGLTGATQTFATGTTGTDFGISSSGSIHTFNLPTASATNRGALSSADWTSFNNKQNALTFGNLTEATSSVLTITGGTGAVIGSGTSIQVKQASGTQSGFLSSTDWTTFNNKQNTITLTTTGSSGAATFVTNTLNIPNYTLSGLGGVPTSRTITINGTAQDLSADRTWSVGTVTSVAALTIGTTGTDITSTVATGTTTPVITLNIPTASATNRGALSSADWSAFNGKQAALNGTGFVKISGTTISYDNTNYLSLGGGTMSGQIVLAAGTTSTDYTKGLRFPNDPYGGGSDTSGLRLYADTGVGAEAQVLELYVTNDGAGASQDRINFSAPSNNLVTINGNSIALNSSLSNYLPLTGGTLTGALNGTSSSMSSTSTATAFIPTGSTVPTNGMYLPSANTVAFAANSTRVIQISASGRVSIGATTPTTDTLTVHGAITTTNGGKITAQGMIEAGSTIFGSLNCIIVSDLSAASITPTGSTAPLTGMYTASSGELSFSTGTQKRFSIASGGAATFSSSVTAGVTTSSVASGTGTFKINNSSVSKAWSFYPTTNGAQTDLNIYEEGTAITAMTFKTGGNVGIGTTSPTNVLSVVGGNGNQFLIDNTGQRYSQISIRNNGTQNAFLATDSTNTEFQVYAGTGYALALGAGGGERMRITSGGAVQATNNLTANSPSGGNTGEGIIAGRSFKLDASGSGQRAAMYVVSNTLSDTYGSGLQIQFANLADTLGFGFNLTTGGSYETYIKSGGSWNRAMTITSGGNVGIGTTSPVGALQVSNGTIGTNLPSHVVNITGNNYTNATIGVYDAATLAANTGGGINFGAFYTGTTFTEFAYIRTNKDNATSGDYGGSLIFATRPNGGSPTERMRIQSNGIVGFSAVYANTTTNAANLYIDSGTTGLLYRSTSSIKYKKDIEDLNIDIFGILNKMRPVWYRSLGTNDRKDWSWYGFIAEELAQIEPRLVHFGYSENAYEIIETINENGEKQIKKELKKDAIKDEPDGVQYERITVLLVKAIQEQQAQIEELKSKLA